MKAEDKKRIVEIDLLKGLAILGTILVHSFVGVEGLISPYVRLFFLLGSMGCQLFFVLSGFCLAKSWEQGTCNVRRYYVKRFCTIAPTYYVVIVSYLALNWILERLDAYVGFEQNKSGWALTNNFLLLHGIFLEGHNDVVPGGWYIGVAWILYLIFPVLISMIQKVKWHKEILWSMFPIAFFGAGQLLSRYVMPDILRCFGMEGIISYRDILYNLPCFMLGIVVFKYYQAGLLQFGEKGRKIILAAVLVLAIATMADYYLALVNHQFTSGLFFAAVLILLLNNKKSFLKKGTVKNCLVRMGESSYAIYFVHIPFLSYILPVIFRKIIQTTEHGTFIFLILILTIIPLINWTGAVAQKGIDYISRKLLCYGYKKGK